MGVALLSFGVWAYIKYVIRSSSGTKLILFVKMLTVQSNRKPKHS
ncbi:hypothetical protein L798_11016 [Zootermopsis nevadensis]|uniref:Uncharacterized protein n=1 Tax=Zootermopsis nevadensis TaxID=136037 RepID=A0A067R6B7_ZOONE|nr:hypothetical protein L798_11016 [Zootermopsis nevadensis]